MRVEELLQETRNKLLDYKIKFSGESPAFFVIHSKAIMHIYKYYNDAMPSFIGVDFDYKGNHRIFGVPVIITDSISENEVLIGITPLQQKEL
jgi:hypothetical protein